MADYNQPDYVEKRVRYFDGQFLKDQDFIDEQKYFLDRQRRYHRFLNVSGIVNGLAVKVKPGTIDLVTVDPGTALDIKGRQVVLSDVVPETDRQIPLQRLRGTTGTVVITYNEEGSDQAQAGSAGLTRFYEKPKLTMVLSGQTVPEGAITLARLTISASGVVEVNNTVRIYAGIRLPYDGAASDHGPELRAGSTNRLEVNSDLSVSGDVNVGRANAQAKLYVNGTMQIAGTNTLEFGAGVSGKEASAGKIGYQTLTSDALDIVGAGTTGSDRKLKFWAEGGATLTGSLSVNGSVGIGTNDPGSDKLKVDGTLSVTGASTLTGNTSIGGTLTVTKASTLTDNISIGGTLTVTKASMLTGNVAIGTPTAKSPLQIKTLTAIAEQATDAGAWANFGSNAYADDTWKRIDETKAGVNFHLNADGVGSEFRFLRVEANGSNLRNIAALGSKVSYILEGNVGIGTTDPGTDKLKVDGTLSVTKASTLMGNVGIGVAAPASDSNIKLAVNGKITGLMFGRSKGYANKAKTPPSDKVLLDPAIVASSDGFVVGILEYLNNNAVCCIEGLLIQGSLTEVGASTSINGVANQDFPILTTSFIMPVRQGETWNVQFRCLPGVHNSAQSYTIYWVPLGA